MSHLTPSGVRGARNLPGRKEGLVVSKVQLIPARQAVGKSLTDLNGVAASRVGQQFPEQAAQAAGEQALLSGAEAAVDLPEESTNVARFIPLLGSPLFS